jgi:hypothetical protein
MHTIYHTIHVNHQVHRETAGKARYDFMSHFQDSVTPGFDDADANDDSGAMVRFAVAIPFDADNQRYAMMPVYGRI